MSRPPAPRRRARLELLVRRDDEAFDVRQIPSASAFLRSRPQRVPPDSFELAEVASRVAGERRFILKNTVTDRFLLLTEPEKFLWEQMDGRTSLQDIATAYVLRYGAFDFDVIPALIGKLQRAGLLTLAPSSRLREVLARNRRHPVVRALETALTGLERVNVSTRNVQGPFSTLYRLGGFLLFTRGAAVLCAMLAVLGLWAGARLWAEADVVVSGFGGHATAAFLSVKLLFLLTLAGHQLVHGLALVHYRRRVREFGFTFLHGIVPTFYVDVTDIFMASRRARVITAVSGALVHMVLGAIWFLAALAAERGSFLQAFAAASGMIQWQAFVIALYPFCFIEMDGYHVLVDVLGIPTLKQEAMAWAGGLLRARPAALGRREALFAAYVVLSTVSVAGFIAFNVWLVVHASG
ncbi:MAG TPA: PqqD family protein [Candidatus Tectomicrobia bacterium]|nr:PqqD family protein [Candidatus Tectomicrobia bacterium]